jgi:hypothetical protein
MWTFSYVVYNKDTGADDLSEASKTCLIQAQGQVVPRERERASATHVGTGQYAP